MIITDNNTDCLTVIFPVTTRGQHHVHINSMFFLFLQMQQQELAQMRQRDANLTALAAIGPRKKRKMDSIGGATPGTAEVRQHIYN